MRRNILNSLTLLGIATLAFACTPKKIIVAPPVNSTTTEVVSDKKSENLKLLMRKDLLFNTLALKGKASLNLKGNENNVTIAIRIQKDQQIWVSVTASIVGEVARALITPDSLLLRNNLEKTYARKPFSYIYKFTNKQVDFNMLQAVLSGNTITDLMTTDADLRQENGAWELSGLTNNLAYRILFNTLLKVSEVSLNDARVAQAFKVIYGEYTPVNAALFPSSLKINSMAGTKKIAIDIDFTKIDINVPLEFPFSVPKSYELIK